MNNRMPKRSFKEKVAVFMAGRNGPDALYNFILYVCIGLMIINLFFGSFILSALYLALFVYDIFRFMSRNIYKRRQENERFLAQRKKFGGPFVLMKAKFRDRKTHVYKKCPSCKNVLRLPKRAGAHTVVCPCCRNKFEVNIK